MTSEMSLVQMFLTSHLYYFSELDNFHYREVNGAKLLFWHKYLRPFCKEIALSLLTISFAEGCLWKLDVVRACPYVLSKHAYLFYIPVSPSHICGPKNTPK